MFLRHLLVCVLCCYLYVAHAAPRVIEAWSYYPAPPFQTDAVGNGGLTRDTVALLQKALADKYEIRLVLLPRARLNQMLENGEKAFVIFAPSAIFGGLSGGTYLWTSALFADSQELVSIKERPIEFSGPESLHDLQFAAMLGHVYPMIAGDMESGKIRADRAATEVSLVSMLKAHYADVITLPLSSVNFFSATDPDFREAAHLSKHNLGSFTRHLMFQNGMKQERDDFDNALQRIKQSREWLAVLKKYGLERQAVK